MTASTPAMGPRPKAMTNRTTIDQRTGTAVVAANLPIADLPLRDLLRERTGLAVFLDNDANVAALAENVGIDRKELAPMLLCPESPDVERVVRLTPDDFEIVHRERGSITPRIDRIDWRPDRDELGEHAHYMLKEIHEQADAVAETITDRLPESDGVDLSDVDLSDEFLRGLR